MQLINLHTQTTTKLMTELPLHHFYFSRFPYIFTRHQPRVHFLSSTSSIISFPHSLDPLIQSHFYVFTHSSLSPCSFHHHFHPFEFANRIYETSIERFRIDRTASKAREIAFDHINDAMLRCNVYSIHERPGSFVNLPRSSSTKISICFERESQWWTIAISHCVSRIVYLVWITFPRFGSS